MAPKIQEHHLLRVIKSELEGPAPDEGDLEDVLQLRSFTGCEEISHLFRYELDLLSFAAVRDVESLVGTSITWGVANVDQAPRYFNGMICRLVAGSINERGKRAYRVEVVPKLWFLTRTANCKIYQGKRTPEIVESILKDFEIKFDDSALKTEKYHPREYCVQYRETAFNFISRLMEEEGIFYFFRHGKDGHTLVLADAMSAFQYCAEKKVRFSAGDLAPNHVSAWEHQYAYRSGMWSMTDYNFKDPSAKLLVSDISLLQLPEIDKYELFDYPGDYQKRADGAAEARIRIEEEETSYDEVAGASQCCTFTPGGKFDLEDHEIDAENGTYAITSIEHTAYDTSREESAEPSSYSNTFTCLCVKSSDPDKRPAVYRPARLTPKPLVQGVQTAVVVGKAGEEIWTDKYGRVRIQFFWDRLGQKDENSTCWVRVAQFWAGKRWGASFWPRVGQEVVVDFLDGDPDRPLIVGSVYNAEQMPPYLGDGLDKKHQNDNKVSGIKSNSTKGGKGYNELRFDDTGGKEQLFLHAQGRMDVRVNGSSMTTVGGSIHVTNGGVDKDGNKHGDYRQLVHKDEHRRVKGDSRTLIEGKESHIVQGDGFDWYKASHRTTVVTEEFTEAPKIIIEASDTHSVKAAKVIATSSDTISLKAPTILIDAGTKVSIQGPSGFIVIDASGISIVGTPMVKINSGGGPGVAGLPSPTSTIGSGAIDDPSHAQEPEPPAGADSSQSGFKSAPPPPQGETKESETEE